MGLGFGGGGSGGGVDLTAPGPIGGGTPSTGAFTGLTLPNQALTAGLAPTVTDGSGSGFSISGSFGLVVSSGSGGDFFGVGYSSARLGSSARLSWVGGASVRGGTSEDLILRRAAAATLQLGTTHATTPTAQTIKAHDVTTGTGADLILKGGTGDSQGGALRLRDAMTGNDMITIGGGDSLGFFTSSGTTKGEINGSRSESSSMGALGQLLQLLQGYGLLTDNSTAS